MQSSRTWTSGVLVNGRARPGDAARANTDRALVPELDASQLGSYGKTIRSAAELCIGSGPNAKECLPHD